MCHESRLSFIWPKRDDILWIRNCDIANLALGEDNLTHLVIQVILLKSLFLSVEHLYVVDLD